MLLIFSSIGRTAKIDEAIEMIYVLLIYILLAASGLYSFFASSDTFPSNLRFEILSE